MYGTGSVRISAMFLWTEGYCVITPSMRSTVCIHETLIECGNLSRSILMQSPKILMVEIIVEKVFFCL